MINIKFDDKVISDEKIAELSSALMQIVQEATGIPEVFAYADSPRIKINVAPVEVFIEMSISKVPDKNILFDTIKTKLLGWKKTSGFSCPITITLTPVDWKFEVGI